MTRTWIHGVFKTCYLYCPLFSEVKSINMFKMHIFVAHMHCSVCTQKPKLITQRRLCIGLLVPPPTFWIFHKKKLFTSPVSQIVFCGVKQQMLKMTFWLEWEIEEHRIRNKNRDFAWARIFKRLWSLGIDSQEWIPQAYVVWARTFKCLWALALITRNEFRQPM